MEHSLLKILLPLASMMQFSTGLPTSLWLLPYILDSDFIIFYFKIFYKNAVEHLICTILSFLSLFVKKKSKEEN